MQHSGYIHLGADLLAAFGKNDKCVGHTLRSSTEVSQFLTAGRRVAHLTLVPGNNK